jgi:antitoxin ChpS
MTMGVTMKKTTLTVLHTPNTWPIAWCARLLDIGDGSGDRMIELPDELLEHLGWKLGDVLELRERPGNEIVIRRVIPSPAVEAMKKMMGSTKLVKGSGAKTAPKKGRNRL